MRIGSARIRLPQRQPRPTGLPRWRAGGVLPARGEVQAGSEVVGDVHRFTHRFCDFGLGELIRRVSRYRSGHRCA